MLLSDLSNRYAASSAVKRAPFLEVGGEAAVRYVKGWASIPDIKSDGQMEIELFAIGPKTDKRYHIEITVTISHNFRVHFQHLFGCGSQGPRQSHASTADVGLFPDGTIRRFGCAEDHR